MTNKEIFITLRDSILLWNQCLLSSSPEEEVQRHRQELSESIEKVNAIAWRLGSPTTPTDIDAHVINVVRAFQDGASRCQNALSNIIMGEGVPARNYATAQHGLSLLSKGFSFLCSKNSEFVNQFLL